MLSRSQQIALDWARGLAAQMVLFGHVLSKGDVDLPVVIQDVGVVLFFVLSGFLITHSAASKSAAYGFGDFMLDRASRIFTPYVPAITFIVILGVVLDLPGPLDPITVTANILMLEDYPLFRFLSVVPEIERVGTGRPLWSVAMEWWIYVAFGVAFFFRGRIPPWGWALAVVSLPVIVTHATIGVMIYIWLAGAAGALAFGHIPVNFLLALALGLAAAFRYTIAADQMYDLRVALLLAAALLIGLRWLGSISLPNWLAAPGAGLAAISYSLYLTHYTVMEVVGWWALILANFVAAAFWWLFERHHRDVASWVRRALTNPDHGGVLPARWS